MGTEKKLSLIFELSHEFELNTQTQNSPKMSHSTQNSNSILKLIFFELPNPWKYPNHFSLKTLLLK